MALASIEQGVAALKRGQVIAYPTEAVFGLGCDPDDDAAIAKLLTIKQRPREKGLILVAANESQLSAYVDFQAIPRSQLAEVRASWPGAATWLVPAQPHISPWLRGQFSTVAVRVSAHPEVQALCCAYGKPITSTSANLSGQAPLRLAAEFASHPGLVEQLACVVDGEVGQRNRPSTIRDACTGEVLRP